jgi:hypothetical protein
MFLAWNGSQAEIWFGGTTGKPVLNLDHCVIKLLTAAHRQSMHRSNPYLESMSARDVRRSTIIDDGPFAFGVQSQGNEEAE